MARAFRRLAAGLVGVVLVLAGCTDTTGGPGGPGVSGSAKPTSSGQWVMPNLVGSTLQAAQDQIQKLTGDPLFLALSHDATGQGRRQVLDENWKVCAQNIAPGTQFGLKTTIDFATVKQDENCP
jgi:hypothetical protein